MAYLYEMPNLTNGMDDMLVDLGEQVSIFYPMLLLFVFMVIFISGSTSQKKKTGFADMPMWATISSLSTLMITLALSLAHTINLLTLVIVVCITIISGAWLFLDKSNREV